MHMTWIHTLPCLLALALMSVLVACGSLANCFNSGFAPVACGGRYGESDVSSLPQPTPTSAEGRWTGTTLTGRSFAGLIQGSGTSHSGFFGSSNTRDFNLEGTGIRAATMHSSYVSNKSFHGTIAYVNGDTDSFSSTYDADYELTPNLTLVAGTYVGLRADNHTMTVTVDSAGTLSGHSSDACTVAGTLSPRGKGNVFHTSVTFGGGACRQGTETVTGVTFYDATTNRLYSAALNNARTTSFLFLGTKR